MPVVPSRVVFSKKHSRLLSKVPNYLQMGKWDPTTSSLLVRIALPAAAGSANWSIPTLLCPKAQGCEQFPGMTALVNLSLGEGESIWSSDHASPNS